MKVNERPGCDFSGTSGDRPSGKDGRGTGAVHGGQKRKKAGASRVLLDGTVVVTTSSCRPKGRACGCRSSPRSWPLVTGWLRFLPSSAAPVRQERVLHDAMTCF